MWETLWPLFLVLANILVFLLFMGHVNRKLRAMREESEKLGRKDERILKLYQEIEDMLNSFEAYTGEVHDEMEALRDETQELARQAKAMYLQVIQSPAAAPPPVPAPPPVERNTPPPAANVAKTEKEVKATGQKADTSRLGPRDRAELEQMVSKGQKVRYLMSRGLSVDETAKELSIGKGEVMLIVDLDKK